MSKTETEAATTDIKETMQVLINEAAEVAAKNTLRELQKERLIKNSLDPYKKTEILLYSYNDYLAAVEEKKRQIEFVLLHGIPQKSKSITSYSANNGRMDEEAKEQAYISGLEKSCAITMYFIETIDNAINVVKDEKYYKIIPMTYFERKTREEIAEYYGTDVGTISRNKKKLIKKLQNRLFSDEVILNLIAG